MGEIEIWKISEFFAFGISQSLQYINTSQFDDMIFFRGIKICVIRWFRLQ